MSDTPESGELDPVADTEATQPEEREYGTLEEGIAALRDAEDDTAESEEPEADEEETEAEEEADDGEQDDDEGEPDEEADADDLSDAVIELPNGETMTVAELEEARANGLRQSDYSRHMSELKAQREQVETREREYAERLKFLETAQQSLTTFVESLLPPEPPTEMAWSNPQDYQTAIHQRNAAMAELQKHLFPQREALEEHRKQTTEADLKRYREGEAAKLVKQMPHLSDPSKMDAFRKSVTEAAVQDFGFSQDEAEATHDHRVLLAMHYARMGKRAEHNRNNAKRRVETPKQGKAKAPNKVPAQQQKQQQVMQRLSKTGSYEDALAAMRFVD